MRSRRLRVALTAIAIVASLLAVARPVAAQTSSKGRTGLGYWAVQKNGVVLSGGDAAVLGRAKSTAPIVGIAAFPGGQGYVLAAADGGVFTFGRAKFYGSMVGIRLQRPVVGIAYSPTGLGYCLISADGGVFTSGRRR